MEFQSLIKDREQVAYTFFAISTSWKTHLEIVPWSQNHIMRCSSWNMAFHFSNPDWKFVCITTMLDSKRSLEPLPLYFIFGNATT